MNQNYIIALAVILAVWTGSTLQEVTKVMALHEWRITALEHIKKTGE